MTPENKTVLEVLSDGKLHPIMSSLKIKSGQSTSFWISDKPELIYKPEDQSESQCYLVSDFVTEKWTREGQDFFAVGRAAINSSNLLGVIAIDDYGYAYDLEVRKKRLDSEDRATKAADTENCELPF